MTTEQKSTDDKLARLEGWLSDQEGEHCEFKEWKPKGDFKELASYVCALANEGGGRIILGVTDKRPRRIVGTNAFPQPEQTRRSLMDNIPLRIDFEVFEPPAGRVLVFEVPSRPVGVPMHIEDKFWKREADSLVSMTGADLRAIFAESGHDFSADLCGGARTTDLDPAAIEEFRKRWIAKSSNGALARIPSDQLLRDAELVVGEDVTYAALILFGSRDALGRFLSQSELIFEYRSTEASGPAQDRKEYRQGFFSIYDALWNDIAKRNDIQHYQDGLFVLDIPTFDERAVREAVLNAVCHRNYQLGGSVYVRQYKRRLVVESPGGLPVGITIDNILDRQSPRNRRLADALSKCGLVERSGQGMNLMFERSIQQGKLRPDLKGTDDYNVVLTLNGEVADPRFVQFLEKVGRERQESFSTQDFLALDLVHREQGVPDDLKPRVLRLREMGVVESVGRGRGTRYILSRRFHTALGARGEHTRRRGLDREQNKELLVTHLRAVGQSGCPISELQQVLPALSRGQIQALLDELRAEGRAQLVGERRGARWLLAGVT